jgi:SAM-dependent methyltransferase
MQPQVASSQAPGPSPGLRASRVPLDGPRSEPHAVAATAHAALDSMLKGASLAGRRFLDLGCRSALFSLAARELGARVDSVVTDHVFAGSVRALRHRTVGDDAAWTVHEAPLSDMNYLLSLGAFDVVHCRDVLRQADDAWEALHNAIGCVAPGGRLYVALCTSSRAPRRGNAPGPRLDAVFEFCRLRGLTLVRLKTIDEPPGCDELVLELEAPRRRPAR